MHRILSNVFFAAAVVLFGLAGYCYFAPPPGPSLEADTDIEVAAAGAGQEQEVVIPLRNISSQPLRVLGLAPC